MNAVLNFIERWGNKLPHPTALFILLCGVVIVASALLGALGLEATLSGTGETIVVKSLISREGLQYFLTNAVNNFVTFAPVGTALVAILGLSIAEHSGLLTTLLQGLVKRTPTALLTAAIVFAGILSSLASDSGYVVLIPLAAIIFLQAGRHPVAGIAAAFAGVSAGYSANLLVGPHDAVLAGLSQEAARAVAPDYTVSITGNYYFMVASTLLITAIATWVNRTLTVKQTRAIAYTVPAAGGRQPELATSPGDKRRGVLAAAACFTVFLALLLVATLPSQGLLRNSDGGLLQSAFTQGIVVIIAIGAALCGIAYGLAARTYGAWHDCIAGMEQHIATMASYLVLMFFAAQFVALFNWSQLGLVIAIGGANGLKALNLPLPVLLISFVFLAGFINLFIGSSSAKWALIAPIFIPMFLLLGLAPEATQIAYRIGDSTTNIISPLMPYFGVVIAFIHHYCKNLGAGTVIAIMLPYSIALLVGWTLLLAGWLLLDWPLGPGVKAFL
ncbi:MAG TPA: AbgT family transporter [Marinagarivorans sp.]